MPATRGKNLLYRAALPLAAPSVDRRTSFACTGHALQDFQGLRQVLNRSRVHGACVMLSDGVHKARIDGSLTDQPVRPDTLFRVASITKVATALVILRLVTDGALALDAPVIDLLPVMDDRLKGITVRHLLSHTSGLSDVPAYEHALAEGSSWQAVLDSQPSGHAPGSFRYCNFGFGLLGCVIEQVTGLPVSLAFEQLLFEPLGMRATLDASTLDDSKIMPIRRILSRRPQPAMTVTALGRIPLRAPDPMRHFGHTAGAMYTDAPSLLKLMSAVTGRADFLPEALRQEMLRPHAEYGMLSPGMSYGLGLVRWKDRRLPGRLIIGHQGFAYGCVDGLFALADGSMTLVSLNGGASEARVGRMGVLNRDLIRWAFGKEMPSWM